MPYFLRLTGVMLMEIEHRYQEESGVYKLQSWGLHGVRTYGGVVDTRPEWLLLIVDVATVANAIRRTKHPPYVYILWFVTDGNHRLIRFLESQQELIYEPL
jgi:hypothetical protein